MTRPDDFIKSDMYGLTKREHFAISALQGILANPEKNDLRILAINESIRLADLLIEQLNKDKI